MGTRPSGISPQKRLEIVERRTEVARLVKLHLSYSDIAKKLGVTESTVSRDMRILLKDWEQEARVDAAKIRGRELQELDQMESEAIENYLRAKMLMAGVTDPKGNKAEYKAWAEYAKAAREFMAQRYAIKDRRARLLNLNLDQTPQGAFVASMPITFIQMVAPSDSLPTFQSPQMVIGELVEHVLDGHSQDQDPDQDTATS